MKEIKRIEIVEKEVTYYEAYDGTIFTDADRCLDYEENDSVALLGSIERCLPASGLPMFDFNEHSELSDYIWYRPKNNEEIKILNGVYGRYGCNFNKKDINEWICVEVCDDYYTSKSTLNDGINYVRRVLDLLGYDIEITERNKEDK